MNQSFSVRSFIVGNDGFTKGAFALDGQHVTTVDDLFNVINLVFTWTRWIDWITVMFRLQVRSIINVDLTL